MRQRRTRSVAPDILQLLWGGVPKILVRVVFLLIFSHGALADDVTMCHVVEFFAGAMQLTAAFQRCSYVAIPFELKLSEIWMDLNTEEGTMGSDYLKYRYIWIIDHSTHLDQSIDHSYSMWYNVSIYCMCCVLSLPLTIYIYIYIYINSSRYQYI